MSATAGRGTSSEILASTCSRVPGAPEGPTCAGDWGTFGKSGPGGGFWPKAVGAVERGESQDTAVSRPPGFRYESQSRSTNFPVSAGVSASSGSLAGSADLPNRQPFTRHLLYL